MRRRQRLSYRRDTPRSAARPVARDFERAGHGHAAGALLAFSFEGQAQNDGEPIGSWGVEPRAARSRIRKRRASQTTSSNVGDPNAGLARIAVEHVLFRKEIEV
jgi:hypothetical protein